jgi:hypothetical protein
MRLGVLLVLAVVATLLVAQAGSLEGALQSWQSFAGKVAAIR